MNVLHDFKQRPAPERQSDLAATGASSSQLPGGTSLCHGPGLVRQAEPVGRIAISFLVPR